MIQIKQKKSGDIRKVTVEGELILDHAEEFKEALLKSLKSGKEISLDLEKVSAVDLSGMQLICSAHRTCLEKKKRLTLSGKRPEALDRTVEDAGYCREKGCAQDEAESCLWVKGGQE